MKPGWKTVKLGDVCKIVNGATPSTSVEANWGGPHCWITPAEMGGLSNPYVGETRRTLTDAGLADCSASLLPAGSVILSSRAPIGHVIINTVPMATNQGCKSMIPSDDLNAKLLFYFIKASVPLLESLGTGATFKELSGGKLASVEIPLPPLAEQKRIVALLDEAFAGIDEAKAKAEANLSSAKNIFERYLQSIFSQSSPGWSETTIGDQITLQRGFDITKQQQKNGLIPVVSSGGVKSYHDTAMTSGPGVVIGRKGTLGKCFFMESDYWPHDTTLWVKDFKGNDPRFVYYLFLGLDVKKFDSGSANPALNRNQIHPIKLTWPKIEMQRSIAIRLDEIHKEVQALTRLQTKKSLALSEIKQSLLRQAFAGELTA